MKSLRWWQRVLLGLVGLLLIASLTGVALLRSSLPRLDGSQAAAALASEVVIERDALGTPTVRGATRATAAYGLGFAHAQDRFFQMDL
ncbi:MAG TPA: penicillin acylase family protein, partial [Steroidobacteraceae bacterium]|nr:penicillin acylase family protein [Steroidobacteraceae bacterium]